MTAAFTARCWGYVIGRGGGVGRPERSGTDGGCAALAPGILGLGPLEPTYARNTGPRFA
jgi:hypothetical protein